MEDSAKTTKKPFFKRTFTRTFIVLLVILLALRIALPYIVLKYANKTLSTMHGYYGHVNDIDIDLYRGAYKIRNIYLHKIDTVTNLETEFFDARLIDLSVHWKALLDGKIVGELSFQDPRIRFTKDKVEPADVKNDTNDFHKLLDDFMPLRVNRFDITNGVIQYIDSTSNPMVDIQLDNAQVLAENLKTEKDSSLLPATVTADANIYHGHLSLKMRLAPLEKEPTFDMNVELNDTHLPELNNFFKAYAKIDVNKGNFGLYSEVASNHGHFVGYVKPIIKDLDIFGLEDRKDNILQKIWEGFAGAVGQLLKNQKHDQVATKIPLEGTFKESKVNILYAILEILENAFIQALQPSIDQEISIASTAESSKGAIEIKDNGTKPEEKKEKKGFFGKLFNKSDKKEEKKKDEKDTTKKQ
jgi:hypothetical protein